MRRHDRSPYRKRLVFTGLAVACCALALGHSPPQEFPSAGAPDSIAAPHVPGEVLVTFKRGVSALDRNTTHTGFDSVVIDRIPQAGIEVVKSSPGVSTEALLQRYRSSPLVERVQPNYIHHEASNPPNDPKFSQQWSLNNTAHSGTCNPAGTYDADIDAPEAWDFVTGNPNVVVAVLDGGVNYNHPDLLGNIWSNPYDDCSNGIDNDGDGLIDDCRGWNFAAPAPGNNDPMDDDGHGTHIAGIIGARGDNGAGTSGVVWRVKVMPVKVFNNGGGTSVTGIKGIYFARDKNVKIINYSASGADDPDLKAAIAASPNVLFISAALSQVPAGVDQDAGCPPPPAACWLWPCNWTLANILCVTDTDQNDVLDPLVNWGPTSVDLAAPGVNILSTAMNKMVCKTNYDPVTQLACCTGSSMAVPHVAGAAALMLSLSPSLSVAQLKSKILSSVDPVPALAGKTVSGGRLNLYKALFAADVTPPTAPANLDAHYDSAQGGVALSWTPSTDDLVVDHYEVRRRPTVSVSYTLIGSPTTPSFLDTTAVTNPVTAYLYIVRAVDASGNTSGYSNVDLATAIAFADDPLQATVTPIRAQHVAQLRTAVNAVRTTAGLPLSSWTDDPLSAGAAVKAMHVTELRAALTAARIALNYSDPPFTDPTITPGTTPIKAIHITELRSRTK
jgi:subtilisin family serine protease